MVRIGRTRLFDPVEGVLFLLILALCVDILVAVVLRYAFETSLGFYDELARYLFVWASFLGAAVGVKRRGHFGVSLLANRFSPRVRKAVDIFNSLGILLFSGFLVSEGLTMVRLTTRQLSPAMEIPVAYLYAVIPISGALMIFYHLPHLFRQVRELGWKE